MALSRAAAAISYCAADSPSPAWKHSYVAPGGAITAAARRLDLLPRSKGDCLLTQRPVEGSERLLGAAQQSVEVNWQDAAGAGVSQGAVVLLVALCVPAG